MPGTTLPPALDDGAIVEERPSVSLVDPNAPMRVSEDHYVINKSGKRERVDFSKIIDKVTRFSQGLNVQTDVIIQQVISNFKNGCTTEQLDMETIRACMNYPTHEQDYKTLAQNLYCDNIQRKCPKKFSEATKLLDDWNVLDKRYAKFVAQNADALDAIIVQGLDREYPLRCLMSWMGLYSLRINDQPMETVQYIFLRCAVSTHYPRTSDDCGFMTPAILTAINKTYYELAVEKLYIPASPHIFNSGTQCGQLSSCFLARIKSDSVEGIYGTLQDDAKMSQSGGGIGNHVTLIRAAGSRIVRTNGRSNGLPPMLKVYNDTARYMDQCVTGETSVYTLTGPKRMKHLVPKDMVLGSDGLFHKICKLVRHEKATNMREIHTENGSQILRATEEHQILRIREPLNLDRDTFRDRLSNGFNKAEYDDVKNLKVGDYLVSHIPKVYDDDEFYDDDDCIFYGLVVMAGHIDERNANIELDVNNTHAIEFVKQYCLTKGLHNHCTVHGNSCVIKISFGTPAFKFGWAQFYAGACKRKSMHKTMMNLSPAHTAKILNGLLLSKSISSGTHTTLQVPFKLLAEQIRYLFLKLGVLIKVDKRDPFTLSIPAKQELVEAKVWPSHVFVTPVDTGSMKINDFVIDKITLIEETKFDGILYDLEVAGPHTYATVHGVHHNGGGKRKGAFAIYIEPWHADFIEVLDMKLPEGKDENRARDLFYAAWTCDLFMKRLKQSNAGKNKVPWSFFCPKDHPELYMTWGKEFEEAYLKAEQGPNVRATVDIWDVWTHILFVAQKTGQPYICFKDHANLHNNQQHVGTLSGSNLCTEIFEYTDDKEIAVCTLASLLLMNCMKQIFDDKGNHVKWVPDYNKIIEAAESLVSYLDAAIDNTVYPVSEAKVSNLRHRYMGIGCQGLADLFLKMRIPYASEEAQEVNHRIFEAMYYGAMRGTIKLAKEYGPYPSYKGSKLSQSILNFDMYTKPKILDDVAIFKPDGQYFNSYNEDGTPKTFLDWKPIREDLAKYGARNALLIALMPTASTTKITGAAECFEPYSSNDQDVLTLLGSYSMLNPHLIRELSNRGLWTAEIYEKLSASGGSVQGIDELPTDIKEMFKTAWEIPMKTMIRMANTRQLFVDQGMSLNMYASNVKSLTAAHLLAHELELKTGSYYKYTNPKAKGMQIKQTIVKQPVSTEVDDNNNAPTKKKKLEDDEATEKKQKVEIDQNMPSKRGRQDEDIDEPAKQKKPQEEPMFCKPGCDGCSG